MKLFWFLDAGQIEIVSSWVRRGCSCILFHDTDSSFDETASNSKAACLDRGDGGVRVVFFR